MLLFILQSVHTLPHDLAELLTVNSFLQIDRPCFQRIKQREAVLRYRCIKTDCSTFRPYLCASEADCGAHFILHVKHCPCRP